MRAVCVAGPSDSGKTTLVETLVSRLARRERVATIKSIHHEVEIDTPGKDTYRHRTAGAEAVVGITPELTFEIESHGKRNPSPRARENALFETDDPEHLALADALERFRARGFDVVLVEGYTDAPLPTILVGDRSPSAVGGEIVGRGDEEPATLVERIRSLPPLEGTE